MGSLRSLLRGFAAAVLFLTRIPVPAGEYRLEDTLVWLPVVGLLLGAGLAAVDWVLRSVGASVLLASTVDVVVLLALSGALHADGLMDTSDAVFGHAPPERRLEIMRDPRVGAFGVVSLVSIVALKIASVVGLGDPTRPALLILAPCLGRWTIVLVATVFPYGRTAGLGAPLAAAATRGRLVAASLLPLLGCILAGPVGILGSVLAALVALGFGRWLMRLLPGLTGDCYGAVCEVVETAVWLSAAIASARGLA